MLESYIRRNTQLLSGQRKVPLNAGVAVSAVLFLLLNVLKVTLFDDFISNAFTLNVFLYKYSITLIIFTVIYLAVFKVKSPVLFALSYILQSLYIYANISYFTYYHSYLHFYQAVMLFSEGMGVVGHSFVPESINLLILLIDLPAFIYLIISYHRLSELNTRIGSYRKLFTVFTLLVVFSMEGWQYVHNFSLMQFINDYSANERVIVERYGTFVNNIVDLAVNRGDKKRIERFAYGQTLYSNKEIKDKPNFVFIQVESMDANVVGQKYKDKYIAPFLQSISQKSIYYPYTMSYHKAGGTSDCEFSIINSIEPLDDFPAIKINNYNYPNSFVGKLSANSYNTVAVHGNDGSYFNRNVAFPKMGFLEYDDMDKMGLQHVGWGAPDSQVFDYTMDKLKGQHEPFLYYVITMSSHGPFTNARNYYNNSDYDDIKDETVRNYFNSISYVDQAINDFVTDIRNQHKNTYVFIWGDHTPGINADLYKQASFIQDEKYFEFTPLIIITPDNRSYMETKKVASFLDIAPTVLYASGVPFSEKTDGLNLLDYSNTDGKIHFKGSDYDRYYLFDKITGKN